MGEISVFQGKLNNEKYEPIDPESKLYLLKEGDSLEFVPTLNLQKEENSIYTDIENLKYSASCPGMEKQRRPQRHREEGIRSDQWGKGSLPGGGLSVLRCLIRQ